MTEAGPQPPAGRCPSMLAALTSAATLPVVAVDDHTDNADVEETARQVAALAGAASEDRADHGSTATGGSRGPAHQ